MDVANTDEMRRGIQKMMTDVLSDNGYPDRTLLQARHRGVATRTTSRQRTDDPLGVLTLLYTSETGVKKTIRRSGLDIRLDIRLAQKSGPTLNSLFTTSALDQRECRTIRAKNV